MIKDILHYNDQQNKDEKTNNDPQNTTQITKL